MKKILIYNLPGKVERSMMGGLGFDFGNDLLPPTDLLILASTIKKYGIEVEVKDGRFNSYHPPINGNQYDFTIVSVSLPTLMSDIEGINYLIRNGHRVAVKTFIADCFIELLKTKVNNKNKVFILSNECDLNIIQQLQDNKYNFCKTTIENIDSLPIASRNLLDHTKYSFPFLGYNLATIQTSRGCPYPCSYYCPYPLTEGNVWRGMSSERIYTELIDIVKANKIDNVLFRDAVFTFDRERVISLCNFIIEKNLKFSWWAETRIDKLDKDLLEFMRYAGCKGLNIGVESCSYLQKALKQKNQLCHLVELQRIANDLGLKFHWLLMVGFPGETKQTVYETWQFLQKYKPDSVGVTSVTPYPGTLLFEKAKINNWLEKITYNGFGGHQCIMRNKDMSVNDIRDAMIILQNWQNFTDKEVQKWANLK